MRPEHYETTKGLIMFLPTGVESVDRVLGGVVDLSDLAFPGRVEASYVIGSVAEGKAVWGRDRYDDLSDLDVCLVLRGHLTQRDVDDCERLAASCNAIGTVRLDLFALGADELLCTGDMRIANAGRLIAGTDIKARLPHVPLGLFIQEAIDQSLFHLSLIRRERGPLSYPLCYPDPAGEFYGYDFQPRPPHGTSTMRLFVAVVCWAATVLVALRSGDAAASKAEAVALAQRHLGARWAALVDDIYATCREAWGYHMPDEAADRRRLRTLCGETLAFENEQLSECRAYLLAQLRTSSAGGQIWTVQTLGRLRYHDTEITAALLDLVQRGDDTLRRMVLEVNRQREEQP